jgi:hypothetical protein
MAEGITSKATGLVSQMFSGSLAIVFWVIIGIVVLAVIFGVYYYFFIYKKKFDIMVKVISERTEDDKVFFDKAALLFDKANRMAFLRLWSCKIELPMPKFRLLTHTNKGDYLELYRKSDKDFRFLTSPEIDTTEIIRADGKSYPLTSLKQKQIENDLSWILHREKVNKSIINPESILMKLLAYAPQIISGVLSLMILWIALRYAPDLLNAMRNFAETIKAENQPEVIKSILPFLLWKLKT